MSRECDENHEAMAAEVAFKGITDAVCPSCDFVFSTTARAPETPACDCAASFLDTTHDPTCPEAVRAPETPAVEPSAGLVEKRFPVQNIGLVPWVLAEEAYRYYGRVYPGQSIDRMAERGGFGVWEMACFRQGHDPNDGWDTRYHQHHCLEPFIKSLIATQAREIAALKEERDRLDRELMFASKLALANVRAVEAAEAQLALLTREHEALKEVLRGSQDVCSVQIQEQRRRAESAEAQVAVLKAERDRAVKAQNSNGCAAVVEHERANALEAALTALTQERDALKAQLEKER